MLLACLCCCIGVQAKNAGRIGLSEWVLLCFFTECYVPICLRVCYPCLYSKLFIPLSSLLLQFRWSVFMPLFDTSCASAGGRMTDLSQPCPSLCLSMCLYHKIKFKRTFCSLSSALDRTKVLFSLISYRTSEFWEALLWRLLGMFLV